MGKTRIEWCDFTINPVKGLCPVGCDYCYARRMYKRFKWNPDIRFTPITDLPKKPSRIFVGSTMELFCGWVDTYWMDSIFRTVKDNPQHTFIFLTKRPENLLKWSPFPENCWVGASADTYYAMFKATRWLSEVKASIKFISFEPLLESMIGCRFNLAGIDWVIVGQVTPISRATTPKRFWIEEIVKACDKTSIPVFLKNNLETILPVDRPFYKPIPCSGWDDNFDWELRQEFPNEELSTR